MRPMLAIALLLLCGCGVIKEAYQKGFDKGFLDKCVPAALKKGAQEARAKAYCECALGKINAGQKPDDAIRACQ